MSPKRKNFHLTTILRDGTRISRCYRAPAGQLFTRSGMDQLLRARMAETESFYPGRHFVAVRLRTGNFNLVERES